MREEQLARIIEKVIPQIYLKKCNIDIDWGRELKITLNNQAFNYITYNTGGRGGNMGKLFTYIENESDTFCSLDLHGFEMESSYVERNIATKWLELETSISQKEWENILDQIVRLQKRTYENLPIIKNIIIDTQDTGTVDISESSEEKLIDVMAGSNYTYFLTDKSLRIVDYNNITWREAEDKSTYSSIPNFLQPFTKVLNGGRVGIALTHTGDIIIYKGSGMIVSVRKGNVVVYDDAIVKNLYRDVLDEAKYGVICNLFDVCWDISYRRHGALIVLALDSDYEKHIVNKESILGHMESMGIRKNMVDAIKQISLKETGKIKNRSIFIELASVDGATIIDPLDGEVKAFGAIIETAKSLKKISGARTTAAKSAISYENMIPIKVSSDGDITLYKKVRDKISNEELVLEYKFY